MRHHLRVAHVVRVIGSATSSLALAVWMSACGQPVNSPLAASSTPAVKWTMVRVPLATLTPEWLRDTGFIRDHKRHPRFGFGFIQTNRLSHLDGGQRDGLALVDEKAWAKGLVNPETLEVALETMDEPINATAEGWHDHAALTQELQTLAQQHPSILQLLSAGKSVQGRDLWYVKISDNVAQDETEPKLLYISTMHGDEVTGVEMTLYLIRKIVRGYGTDARMTKLVNHSQLFLMPLMNPDGNALHQRFNANGVDLNRDFPDFTSDPTDTPAGRAIETQAIMRLHDQHQFALSLNFHGGEICFNLPWDTKRNTTAAEKFGDDALMSFLGREFTTANQPMFANDGGTFDQGLTYGYEWYEVDGGMQDWSNYYRQSNHATVELSTTKWPSASQLPAFWRDNEEAFTKFLERGLEGVHLQVVAPQGRAIQNPVTAVSTATRDIKSASVFIHRPTVPGAQVVTINAPGFARLTMPLSSSAFDGTFTQAQLTPLNP